MKGSAVYKVQCYTFGIARELTGSGFVTRSPDHPFLGFRCKPECRTPAGKELRRKVAAEVRRRRCKHDFSGVGIAGRYKGEYIEVCRKCRATGEIYEKDYS